MVGVAHSLPSGAWDVLHFLAGVSLQGPLGQGSQQSLAGRGGAGGPSGLVWACPRQEL